MSYSYCNYCNRSFKFKDLYTQHVITCEFFYKKKRDVDRDIETFEVLPTQQELYKLVQHLVIECGQLRKEVDKLKNTTSLRRKQMVVDYLTTPAMVPYCTFEEWTIHKKDNYKHYLDHIYQENLTEGVKKYMNDMLSVQTDKVPIKAFTEKPNTIYIYSLDVPVLPVTVVKTENDTTETTPQQQDRPPVLSQEMVSEPTYSWKVLSNERLIKWIGSISHKLLQEFTKMQYANIDIIMSNDTERDKNITFMIKMNGGKVSDERRCSEIRKWLMSKIAGTAGNPGSPRNLL